MKSNLAILALAVSSKALVARQEPCCFHLTAYSGEGGPSDPVGQLSDGQNRIGDNSLPEGDYCIGPNGGLTDSQHRGCILTPPTTQYQCDKGAAPTPGFAVGTNGTISYKGDDTFWACPTGQNGGYNIYDMQVAGQDGCVPIWLVADNCMAGPPPTAPPSAPPAPPAPKACPGELTGNWQGSRHLSRFPHLIIPIDQADADKAAGTQYNGTAAGSISSIFNFDLPTSYAGKMCTVEFLFPTQDQLETSAFTFSPGKFQFAFLSGVANQETDYANAPKVHQNFGDFALAPGTATTIGKWPCAAGKAVSFWMSPVGSASLNYFQDSNPCPIGMYVTAA